LFVDDIQPLRCKNINFIDIYVHLLLHAIINKHVNKTLFSPLLKRTSIIAYIEIMLFFCDADWFATLTSWAAVIAYFELRVERLIA